MNKMTRARMDRKNARERERRANDPEWRKRDRDRKLENRWRKRGVQFTVEERDAMLASQGGRCAICGTDKPGGRGDWHTDHCHVTRKVRGLLCHKCNNALGLFKDNPGLMRTAASYVEVHSEAGKSEAA